MEIMKADIAFKIESAEVIALLAYEAEPEEVCLEPLSGDLRDFCRRLIVSEGFKAKAGSMIKIPVAEGGLKFVAVAGIGKREEVDEDSVRQAAFSAVRAAASKGAGTVFMLVPDAEGHCRASVAAQGAELGNYWFDKYIKRTEDDRFRPVEKVLIADADEQGLRQGKIIAQAQIYARDMANEPGNVVSPAVLAAKAQALATEMGLECEIWNEKRILDERMGAFYAVGQGSAKPPRFIRVTYTPKEPAVGHTVLVGKGITFDSGGLDIKPADFMVTMKGDKSGASAVLGAIRAAAQLGLPRKVTAIIAAAENMPGANAYRPDDILRARNGKTIEINNTDAEGRLTLADALCYASELGADEIVDIATLTGACPIALGTSTAGLFANDDALAERLTDASKKSGERVWQLPMTDSNLRKQLKSPVADVVNCGSRYGGAITAAMFLEEFVKKGTPWAHLDIAATDFIKEPYSYYVKGASGFGARMLTELLIGK